MSNDLSALVARLEAVAGRLETASKAGGGGGGDDAGGSASVEAYDEIIAGEVKAYLDLSVGIGGDVAAQSELVSAAFAAQRAFLVQVSESKKPADADFMKLIGATSAAMGAVSEFKEKNFKSKEATHLSAVAEGLAAMGWVTISPKPAPYVKDMADAGSFYSNRVIKDNKETNPSHVQWARSYVAIWGAVEKFVKAHHTTGLVWNPKGGAAAPAAVVAPNPTAAAAAAPTKPKLGSGGGGGGLFAELSKGGGVTAGLKKVGKDQMTHKNPELRATSVVKASDGPKVTAAPKFGASTKVYDPVFELQGKKWVVEHQKNNQSIVIEAEANSQLVYIYKCTGSTIQIKGKVAAITMDGCTKTACVFEDCVAAFELVNCKSVQAQVTGKVATISIDKTDGAAIYLSEASIDAEIISAKSSEMNVSVPNLADPEGDMIEMALPEQFKSVFNKETKKMDTNMTDIAN